MSEISAEEFREHMLVAADLLDGTSVINEDIPEFTKRIVHRMIYREGLKSLTIAHRSVESFPDETVIVTDI
jgi:hypothetical protein